MKLPFQTEQRELDVSQECGGAAVQGAEHSAGLLDCGAASLQPDTAACPGTKHSTINGQSDQSLMCATCDTFLGFLVFFKKRCTGSD